MRVIISGGGTGGHIYPAVAIANGLKAQNPTAEILFVGALGKMEMEKVPKAGYEIIGLPVVGFNRSNLLSNIGFPIKLWKSLYRAYQIVKEFKPDIAVGVGGFASGPTLFMANLLGVKTLIQEQNSFAGVTNKILARKARKICVAYPGMEKFFGRDKVVFTGNPVRNDLLLSGVTKSEALSYFGLEDQKPTVLVIGGSLGALSVNKAIMAGLPEFEKNGIQLVWQTGKGFIEEAGKLTKGKKGFFASDFIYDMDKAYSAADLVVSRAGALSISELSLLGKAAVLVPFPYAAEDHQTQNALSLSSKEAAILIPDNRVSSDLLPAILGLVNDKDKIYSLEKAVKEFAKPDAVKEIVEQIKQIVSK